MEHRQEEEPSPSSNNNNNNVGGVVDLTLTSPFIDDNHEDSEIEFLGTKKKDDKSNNIDGVADYRAAAKMKYEQSLLSCQSSNQGRNQNNNSSITSSTDATSTQHHPQGDGSIRNLSTVEKLNTKQTLAYNLAIKDGKSIFITGPAGTGKSVLLKHIMATLEDQKKKRWAATSSTGTTAVALGGETLHHFAGCGVPSLVSDFGRCWKPLPMSNWQSVEVLIIDEISMLAGEFLDNLSDVVKQIRHDNRAFGGIQLILCGDFLQLPPIPRNKNDVLEMLNHGKDLHELHCNKGFAFQSKVWEEANMTKVVLDEVFRQSNNKFIEVLHEVRKGNVSTESEAFLRKCERPLPPTKNGIIPTKLYSRNKNVAEENNAELAKLPGSAQHYSSIDYVVSEPFGSSRPVMKGEYGRNNGLLSSKEQVLMRNDFWDQCQAQSSLELKPGAQVMLIQNFSVGEGEKSLANGSRGKVVEITEEVPKGMVVMEAKNSHPEGKPLDMPYAIVEFLNGEKVAIGACTFECILSGVGVCIRIAIPLKLAWAISIHKSQGMTLDYVKCDLKGVFSEAQVYVALSRASNENGLELCNFNPRLVRCDWRAMKFYTDPTYKPRLWNEKPPASNNGGSGMAEERPPPANPGSLQGLSIVFTGELGSFDRFQAESLVKSCGGVVRGSVSGKTNILVVGTTLEDGREVESTLKYKKAKEIIDGNNNKSNLRIIDKSEFFALIKGTKPAASNSQKKQPAPASLSDKGSLKVAAKSTSSVNGTSNKTKSNQSKGDRRTTRGLGKMSNRNSGSASDCFDDSNLDHKIAAGSDGRNSNVEFFQFKDGAMGKKNEPFQSFNGKEYASKKNKLDNHQPHKHKELPDETKVPRKAQGHLSQQELKNKTSVKSNTTLKFPGRGSKKEEKMKSNAKKRCRFDSSSSSDDGGEEMRRKLRERQEKMNKRRMLPNLPPSSSSDEGI